MTMPGETETTGQHKGVPGGRHASHVGSPSLDEQERKLAVYSMQRERTDVYLALVEACQHDAKRQILTALYTKNGTATYDGLEAFVNRHRRKIKKHVAALDQDGIVERGGNPAAISFTDADVALLTTDTLSLTDPL